jgi:hypothetical protein
MTGVRRRIEIDNSLFDKLEYFAKNTYDASINKLVNIAILELIETKDVKIYERPQNEKTAPHNFLIRNSSYKELEKLKMSYGVSIFKLVNIAIYNAINYK